MLIIFIDIKCLVCIQIKMTLCQVTSFLLSLQNLSQSSLTNCWTNVIFIHSIFHSNQWQSESFFDENIELLLNKQTHMSLQNRNSLNEHFHVELRLNSSLWNITYFKLKTESLHLTITAVNLAVLKWNIWKVNLTIKKKQKLHSNAKWYCIIIK